MVKIGDEATFDSYTRMPIENFGKNVLSKLGWKEDGKMPLGRNAKAEDYKEPNFSNLVPRQNRLGLGAKPLTHDQAKKINRNSDTKIRVIEPKTQ